MHYVFERWVEHLVGIWSRDIGGQVSSGRAGQTMVPIRWDRPAIQSLTSLVPDLAVCRGRQLFIFDAKYKGHFEELYDERRLELRDELRAEHRHDLHQVLAYASLYGADEITAVLVLSDTVGHAETVGPAGRGHRLAAPAAGRLYAWPWQECR